MYILIVAVFIGTLVYFNAKITSLTKENAILNNNNKAYEQELENLEDSLISKRVTYEMTVRELNNSKNKIVKELNNARKEIGIKDKQIKELTHFNSTITLDTTIMVNINEECEFDTVIEYNPQTVFKVAITKIDTNTVLRHSADISGSFNAYTYESTEWKESNFFKRLFLFRWKKYHYESNVLASDNALIKIKDFKVIKVIN
jgi:sugar-specific transcriptional regulator TrmB